MGSLAEKSITTKEQYPLTFNSLLNACNQKSSRDPIMQLDLEAMGRAVQSLITKGFVERIQAPGERAPKFHHDMGRLLGTDDPKVIGVMTVLLLRGPQTPGELKTRTERLCAFESTAEVEGLMQQLCARAEDPLAARLPRQSGQKEARYGHLFFGAVQPAPAAAAGFALAAPAPAGAEAQLDRVAALEKRVETLEVLVSQLSARIPKLPEAE